MSPALLSRARARRSRTQRFAAAALTALAAFAFASPVAHAAVTKFSFTDPAGDASGYDFADLLSGTATYDSTTGAISVTVTTKADPKSANPAMAMYIGFGQSSNNTCQTQNTDGSDVGLVYFSGLGQDGAVWSVIGGTDANGNELTGDAVVTHTGFVPTFVPTDPNGALKGKSFNCFQVQSLAQDSSGNGNVVDSAVTYSSGTTAPSGGSGSSSGGSSGSSSGGSTQSLNTAPVTTTQADADHDGTPDSADKCPTIPGAQADGCPTMPTALEVRLGAKRVVIDRLVQRTTASTCPKGVRVHVTAKGKLIGNTVIATSQFGSFCRVDGVIKLKKSVKTVRVTMKSTGLASIAKSARR